MMLSNEYFEEQLVKNVKNQKMVGELDHSVCLPYRKEDIETSFFYFQMLDSIGRRNQTDKCSDFNDYLRKYEFFFREFKEKAFTLLELGIYQGGSLRTWSEYFTKARIVGVDITEECKQYAHENCEVIISDLSKKESIEELRDLSPSIIIDDASHRWSHQIMALNFLFPCLSSNGIYVLEDITTSFPSFRFMNYGDAVISAYDFLSAIAEVVTGNQILRLDTRADIWKSFHEEIEEIAQQISMISFVYGSCIMVKK